MELRNRHFKSHLDFLSKYDQFFSLQKQSPKAYTCWLAFPMIVNENAPFNRTDMQIFLEKEIFRQELSLPECSQTTYDEKCKLCRNLMIFQMQIE